LEEPVTYPVHTICYCNGIVMALVGSQIQKSHMYLILEVSDRFMIVIESLSVLHNVQLNWYFTTPSQFPR